MIQSFILTQVQAEVQLLNVNLIICVENILLRWRQKWKFINSQDFPFTSLNPVLPSHFI